MAFYNDCDVNVQGGTSNIIAGDQINKNTIHNYGSRTGFEQLQKQVAVNALHNSGEVSDQPKCHPGTRVAILDHLIAWAAALTYTYPIIWLHGPAGAGKSAILRTVAQLLFNQGLLLASFFFFRTSAGRNSHHNFIATIAYQLTLSMPATRPHIERAMKRNPLILSLSLWDQAQALIHSPLLAALREPSFNASQCPRIIIIDGLDECQDSNKQCEILDVLCRILQILPIPFAVLIASRPQHHIRNAFDLGDLNRLSSRLSLDDSYNPDADIKKFLVDRFTKIQERHPFRAYLPTSWPMPEVIGRLVAKASGQFIYASTVDRFISSIRHNPAERLDILLGNFDAGTLKPFEQLDSLYSTIFHSIDQADLAGALRVLGAVMVLFRPEPRNPHNYRDAELVPCSPRFLERLLELGAGSVRSLLFDLESLLIINDDDKVIRFFHASLSDYLFDKSRSGQFWIDAGMVYADFAQRCLLRLPYDPDEWRAFQSYFQQREPLFLPNATPTLGLHKAIQNIDMRKVVRLGFGYYDDLRPMIIYGTRRSKFPDAEKLYRAQMASYGIRTTMQEYFKDTPARYAFITVILANEPKVDPESLKHIFGLSNAMLVYDSEHGLNLLSRYQSQIPSAFRMFFRNLFNDTQEEFFIDDNQYADIASYLMKFMSLGPEDPLRLINSAIPMILSKSSIRYDLNRRIESVLSSRKYDVEAVEPSVRDAMADYTSRSGAAAKSSLLATHHEEPETVVNADQASVPVYKDAAFANTTVTKKPGFFQRFVRKRKDGTA